MLKPLDRYRRGSTLFQFTTRCLRAMERNRTPAYRREMNRRRTIAEGAFASLDRLGRARSRLRGLWKSLPPRMQGWTVRGSWHPSPTK